MADPLSLQLLDTLMARAARILVSGGYQTNAGARVYLQRATLTAADLPCVVFRPSPITVAEVSGASERMRLDRPLTVEAVMQTTLDTCGEDGERLLADLQVALLDASDLRVGGQAIRLTPTEMRAEPRDDGGQTVGAALSMTLQYVTGYGDPYT